MLTTLLVELTGDPTDAATLETAFLTARLFEARMECVHVGSNWHQRATGAVDSDFTGAMVSGEFLATLEREAKVLAWRAHRHFSAFSRHRSLGALDVPSRIAAVSATWREFSADRRHELLRLARVHDLAVMPHHQDINALGSFVLNAGRPILLAPRSIPENLAPTIAIAWKNSPESARAITAAMPLLAKAEKILVLSVEDGNVAEETVASTERVVEQLSWHGFNAKAHHLIPCDQSVAATIERFARSNKADLIVSGAYGHSRLRELVLGGVTRDLLRECSLPLFLFH
jgi:nucleotide-binding universal stress UspA family protein